jgi:sugar lactone lactonase YvrE
VTLFRLGLGSTCVAVLVLFGGSRPPGRGAYEEPLPPEFSKPGNVVVEDTVKGIVIVQNEASGLWREGEGWELETEWRTLLGEGGEAGRAGLLTTVSLGPDGCVYLLDFSKGEILVFGGNGKLLRRLGGPGSEPGRFDGPLALAWDPFARLWVADGWNGRYMVFDTAGDVVKVVPRPLGAASGWAQVLAFDGTAHLIDETAWRQDERSVAGFLRVDTTGSVEDTFPPLPSLDLSRAPITPGELLMANRVARTLRPFKPRMVHTRPRNGSIWFARSDDLRLIHRDLRGDTLRIVETRHRRFSLSPGQRQLIRRTLGDDGVSEEETGLGRQVIQAIHVLGDGHLLVQIEEEAGEPSRVLDVFNPQGRFLGSLRMEERIRPSVIPAIQGDTLIAVTMDRNNQPHLVRMTLRRSGN